MPLKTKSRQTRKRSKRGGARTMYGVPHGTTLPRGKHRGTLRPARISLIRGRAPAKSIRPSFISKPYFDLDYAHSVAEALEEHSADIMRAFEEDLETTGVLPEDRSVLDEMHLSQIENLEDELRELQYALHVNPRNAELRDSYNSTNNTLALEKENYMLLRQQQHLQDSLLSKAKIEFGGIGQIYYIDITVFEPSFYSAVYGDERADRNPFDIRIEARIGQRLTEGKTIYSPLLQNNAIQRRILPAISSAQLRILDDNLFGVTHAFLARAEEPIYRRVLEEYTSRRNTARSAAAASSMLAFQAQPLPPSMRPPVNLLAQFRGNF